MTEIEKLVDTISQEVNKDITTLDEMFLEGAMLKFKFDYPTNIITDILLKKYLPILKEEGLIIDQNI